MQRRGEEERRGGEIERRDEEERWQGENAGERRDGKGTELTRCHHERQRPTHSLEHLLVEVLVRSVKRARCETCEVG